MALETNLKMIKTPLGSIWFKFNFLLTFANC